MLRIGSEENSIGAYVKRDAARRTVHELEDLGLTRGERERINREVLNELDCDLAERREFTFYMLGAVYDGLNYQPLQEEQAYERLIFEVKRELGIANFYIPHSSGVGIAVFHEAPSRECLRLLAKRLYGVNYFNVFERRNVNWPRFLGYWRSAPSEQPDGPGS